MADIPATGQQPANKTGITGVTALGAALGGGVVAAILLSLILLLFGAFNGANAADVQAPAGFVSADFAKGAAEIAAPSVVTIMSGSELVDPKTGAATSAPASTGSGVIISEDGYIVTNNHVVTQANLTTPQDEVLVQFGAEWVPARIVGRDAQNDIAVVKVDRTGLDPIEIGSSDELKPGDPIVVIGNPKFIGISVSTGIVSAVGRTFGGELVGEQAQPGALELGQLAVAIQVDAMVNHGNSGGALVNKKGELVGIPSAGLGDWGPQGLNFCIPIGIAKGVIEDLIATGRAYNPYLGANTATIDLATADQYKFPVEQGAYILSVDPGSPAQKVGLQADDIIAKVDGKVISTQLELAGIIRSKDINQKVKLEVWRFNPETQEWAKYETTATLIQVKSAR